MAKDNELKHVNCHIRNMNTGCRLTSVLHFVNSMPQQTAAQFTKNMVDFPTNQGLDSRNPLKLIGVLSIV